MHNTTEASNSTFITEWRKFDEPENKNEESKEINNSEFALFLEEVQSDYQNSGEALRTSLDKFKNRYNVAKSKSISRLSSFLYDLNRDLDPMVRVNSGAQIHVQVESIKRRKTIGDAKQRLHVFKNNDRDNLDPQTIPV